MNPIKKIIIEESAKVLREMKDIKKTSNAKSNLYEAIKTAELVKDNPRKYKIAKKLITISENRFIKERNRLKEEHGPEDESDMAKAQLSAIMEKANELYRMMDGVTTLEDWLQYKLSIAENYIDAVHGYMKYFNGGDEMESEEMYDDDKTEWDDVEEEDYEDEFDDIDDMDFEDDEEYYDGDFEDDEEYDVFDDSDDEFSIG
jgi:hypothetical protein